MIKLKFLSKVQIGLLFLLIASQIDFIVGVFMGPSDDASRSKGFVGLNGMLVKLKVEYSVYEDQFI